MKKITSKIFAILGILLLTVPAVVSCSDEPSSENYYSFKGEMMSEYLQNREEFSKFAEIVDRAGLMKQLSAYGHYTCFCPTNSAVDAFLQSKGRTLDGLSQADCDTIARTHLVSVLYSTFDMKDGVLATQNMNRRPIEISHKLDNDSNSVVVLNKVAVVTFATQNDSVENGIMHPIEMVLESSTNSLPDLIKENPEVSIFYNALMATGLAQKMTQYKDDSYVAKTGNDRFYDYITGSNIHEAATDPDEHLYGYTAFLVPDAILEGRYHVHNIEDLYYLACEIYDEVYPEDKDKESHKFENISDPANPLYRFMAYHLLDRNVQGWNYLTVRDDFGVLTTDVNPTDWYTTMLPYTMIKVQHLTVNKYVGAGTIGERYINRRYDDQYQIEGSHVQQKVENYDNMALNGIYFYVDEVLKFDSETYDKVDNCRIRMDFSTIFPEVMTNDMRMNGDRTKDDDNSTSAYDHTYKYGRNFYFPNGYLEGVTVAGNGYFIYRRPRQGYWSLHGDEFICQGNYDISFRIPPVPFEGDWQIRLGYAAMPIRGIAQIYFDNVPQGIPLDMTRDLGHSSILGTEFGKKLYTSMNADERLEDRKTLKNLGFYRGTNGGYRTGGSDRQHFSDIKETLRIVLCTVHIAPGEEHFLRVRAVSSKQGNNNEVMLDYLELVPKSVYGVVDDGAQEDDL
ncbi:MAG: fasciclin domain-containing protein [Bacteroidales bacterium]|nr:fasciclin domain-containing protein [Candidatus Liminaster caballi]